MALPKDENVTYFDEKVYEYLKKNYSKEEIFSWVEKELNNDNNFAFRFYFSLNEMDKNNYEDCLEAIAEDIEIRDTDLFEKITGHKPEN